MSESFFLSNTSPQTPSFNRGGLWRKLENKVNSWGKDTLIVVTGPIFKDNMGTIGSSKVTVPGYFYKVIYSPSKQAMIGFLLPHAKVDKKLKDCVVKVDRIEEETGIDFFPQLEDPLEVQLEATVCLNKWDL
jgi:endonuclease G